MGGRVRQLARAVARGRHHAPGRVAQDRAHGNLAPGGGGPRLIQRLRALSGDPRWETILEAGRRTSSGSTDDRVAEADALQYRLDEGPCLAAAALRDLAADDRTEVPAG